MKLRRLAMALVALLLAAGLTSCGGGGGSDGPGPGGSSNWDELIWDVDGWA